MLLSQHLEPDRDKSGASKLNDGQGAGERWRCPSCRDAIDLAHQVACNCGYRVCQPCWQIAANFGGQCPTCGCPPDMESVRQRTMCGHPSSSSRGDRSTSSSAGSTISRSNTPCLDPPSLHHQHSQPSPRGKQLTPVSSDFLQQQQQQQDHQQVQLQLLQQQQQQQSVFIRGADRRVLQNLRVIQRTLVYAIGLSPNFAQANTLKQPEYFGQYGDITKLVINHHQGVSPDDPRYGSASAYITFSRKEDAWAAICSVDGFRLMGRTIRASFGTTKYCNSFLRNLPCNNPECLYLHELGDEGDRFTKDEVQLGLARHGSSFAFKEEVLGDRSGNPGGSRSSKPRPANPVLPPPCPMTPPAGYEGGLSNNGGGTGAVGRIPAPPPQSAPPACHPGTEYAAAPGAVGFGGDVRWAEAPPDSPLPIGADGRPRPRRRRGQRGRRGGGVGLGGTRGVNMGGRHCDSDEGSMFGSGGMGLTAPAMDVGIGGGPSLVRTSSIPVPPVRSMVNDCGAGGYGQGLTSSSLDSAMGRQRAADACAASGLVRPSSAASGSFALSDSGVAVARNSEQRFDAGGGGYGGGGFSSDLHHPAPKPAGQHQSWGGSSDRSTPVGGSYVGRNYWVKGRGSPLDTPETLTNTPPVELSPSGAYSPPSTSTGLGGASSQGMWPHRVFGEASARGEDRDKDGQVAAGGMYVHHRHLQLRPPPAFFGIGDGPQASRGQQQNALHEGSRLGDLVSISEFRQTSRQGRSRSLDFVDEQHQQQQSARWDSGGRERTSMGVQMQRQPYLEMEHDRHEGEKGVSLFTSRSHGGISGSVGVASREPSGVNTSMPPPPGLGLTLGGGGGGRSRVGDRPSTSYSDDLSSCSDRLAALSWDDNGAGGNHAVAVSSASSYGRANGGGDGGGGGGGGDGDECDTWMPPPFASVDSFVSSASQAEATQWRRATPKLFA